MRSLTILLAVFFWGIPAVAGEAIAPGYYFLDNNTPVFKLEGDEWVITPTGPESLGVVHPFIKGELAVVFDSEPEFGGIFIIIVDDLAEDPRDTER